MNKKKILSYTIGITGAFASTVGLITLVAPKAVAATIAIVMICLSLATGILIPNHISLIGLIAGICMLVFPLWIVGIIFTFIGAAIASLNIFISKRHLKLF